MSLENLARIGKLKRHRPSREEIMRLLRAAERNIRDAHVGAISVETRFDAAYKACMQCGLVALLANGYRPSTSTPGHHATVIQSLTTSIALPNERVIVLDKLRRLRNVSDYTGEGVSEEEAAACVRSAEDLLAALKEWLRAHRKLPPRDRG